MTMTNDEIVRDYLGAANQKKQIEVLAQLNDCDKMQIVNVLAEAGAISNQKLGAYKRLGLKDQSHETAPVAKTSLPWRTIAKLAKLDAPVGNIEAAATHLVEYLAGDTDEDRLVQATRILMEVLNNNG